MNIDAKRYFLASYTGKGYVHFFNEEMQSLNYTYILNTVPGNGQSTLMKNIAAHFHEKGEPLELIHQAADAEELDGLILKGRKIGIFDGASPHVIGPTLPYINGEYVNLSDACHSTDLERSKHRILRLKEQMDAGYQDYSRALAKMFSQHEHLEEFYSNQLDIEQANKLASDTIQIIFGANSLDKEARIKDRFVEASSEDGHIDFVEEITKECTTRYFITGRPGSGKSVFMTKIAEASRERGYDVERYHCGFDPDSIDLILIPELGVAAFDSTPPHDHKPSRAGDEIIDTYALIKVDPETIYKEQIADIHKANKELGAKADAGSRQTRQAYQEIEELYKETIDFDKVKDIENELIAKLN